MQLGEQGEPYHGFALAAAGTSSHALHTYYTSSSETITTISDREDC